MVVCAICGTILKGPTQITFCSSKCANSTPRPRARMIGPRRPPKPYVPKAPVDLPCDLCGKTFTRVKNRAKYCSARCASKARTVAKYGLSNKDWRELSSKGCSICGKKYPRFKLHIEHDHESNEIYGLTCPSCNYALGNIRRNPLTAFGMINYLTNPPARMLDGKPRIVENPYILNSKYRRKFWK